jgi:antitoxin component YwqK of YwqJK toxin-antitoxin module
MKINSIIIIISAFLLIDAGCTSRSSRNAGINAGDASKTDTISKSDTGFTGIKKFYSNQYLVSEVTFENGIRQGLMKTYYPNGRLRQTFWYRNNKKEDTAKWYYEDGQHVFRDTPYKSDSMNGTQIQYYKSGKIKAKLNFRDGLREPYLEEFSMDGQKVTDYPELTVKITDEYKQKGLYKIILSLSNKSKKVTYYQGDYIDGLFVPKKLKKISDTNGLPAYDDRGRPVSDYNGIGYLVLKKSGSPTSDYVGVIAEIVTGQGNKYLAYKKIDLPYKDLK